MIRSIGRATGSTRFEQLHMSPEQRGYPRTHTDWACAWSWQTGTQRGSNS